MAARAYAGTANARTARRRPAARRRPGPRSGASRIHWDRVGRVALTLVLIVVAYSYVNPMVNFVKTYTATTAAKAERHEQQAENTRLHNRVQSADEPEAITRKARAQGMIVPGETPFSVRGVH